ncbi:MAG: AAA family ATPase [Burkholderiales bacterium]|nr:AAA family ATPase [Burkholderiales bacterium]
MLSLTLLGPPALRRDDVEIALPIRKSMALLLLLARQDAPLPRGRVAAMLWPGLGEPDARRNLRRELARLREAGAGDALRIDGDRLALGDVRLDVATFGEAFAAGRVDDALALWRGPPADGFFLGDADAFDTWLAAERESLVELRRRALQASAVALEARGERAAALERVQALLAEDPLQEQHHRDAMRLLAAAGRREAALAQYERCRAVLRSELGLAPMAETEALAASLRGEPGTNAGAAPRAPAVEPSGATAALSTARNRPTPLPEQLPFVGRDAEVAALEAAWSAAVPIVVEGEGGLGKTRLATDFAAAHGPYAMARCRAGDAEVPYASFARAMRALLGPSATLPASLPDWIAAEVARLIPELGPGGAPLRTDEERSRFFEACARAWEALSADDFDAVVVDDWHLADAASRVLFAFIARRRREAGGAGAREILVLRPDLDAAASEALTALREASGAAHLRLRPLAGAEVLDLVRRLSGASEPTRFAERLARATGGNPFFLAETLRHLAESGLLTLDAAGAWQTPFDASTEDYREMPVPASVHEAVRARAERLAPATRRVLEAAALAAEPFSPRLLAPACALSELDTVLAIEEAVAARLLREHERGGFAFAHDLAQQSIAGTLSLERARLVHRRLALGAEAAGAAPATIAAHHEASGDKARAVAPRIAAGDDAKRLRAHAAAIEHWQHGLADLPTPAQEIALRERLSQVAFDRNDNAFILEQADALQRLLAHGDLSPDDRTGASVVRAQALERGSRYVEAIELLDTLPDELPGRLRFSALRSRADAHEAIGQTELARQATAAAIALPDIADVDRIEVLDFAFMLDFNAGLNDAALVHADASLALARRLNHGPGLARGNYHRGIVLISTDDKVGAAKALRAAADDAQRLGWTRLQRLALYNITCAYGPDGRHREALAAAEEGWNLEPPLEASDFRVMYWLAMVDAHFALGDLGAASRLAVAAVEESMPLEDSRARVGAANCTLELLGLVGELGLARRLIDLVKAEALVHLRAASEEMWVALAQFELRHGELSDAAEALARLDADGEAVVIRVRARRAQAMAELALLQGDPSRALATLPTDVAEGMNDEMRIRGLALRVAAEAATGRIETATAAKAAAVLAAPACHEIATLELHTALARAEAAGVGGVPAGAGAAHAACVAKLAATLDGEPARRAAFRRAVG